MKNGNTHWTCVTYELINKYIVFTLIFLIASTDSNVQHHIICHLNLKPFLLVVIWYEKDMKSQEVGITESFRLYTTLTILPTPLIFPCLEKKSHKVIEVVQLTYSRWMKTSSLGSKTTMRNANDMFVSHLTSKKLTPDSLVAEKANIEILYLSSEDLSRNKGIIPLPTSLPMTWKVPVATNFLIIVDINEMVCIHCNGNDWWIESQSFMEKNRIAALTQIFLGKLAPWSQQSSLKLPCKSHTRQVGVALEEYSCHLLPEIVYSSHKKNTQCEICDRLKPERKLK